MELILSKGRRCIIDDADYPKIQGFRWAAVVGRHTCYALVPPNNENRKSLYMHRLIVDAPANLNVDHVNKNGLDNRRANLRLCTSSQNQANRGTCRRVHMIPYKGVFYRTKAKRYFAVMVWEGRKIQLGTFKKASNAAKAYDRCARKLHGAFGRYNFPRLGERGISDHE